MSAPAATKNKAKKAKRRAKTQQSLPVAHEDTLGYQDDNEDEALRYHGQHDGHSRLPPSRKKSASALPPMSHPPSQSRGGAPRPGLPQSGHSHIWNTSSVHERQAIKSFWLELSEEERKGLLKIEKEAVLKKMKAQQRSACSCSVCGRKRTAIEEELEVLYEGYYEELEQYASTDSLIPDPLQRRPHPLATPPPLLPQVHRTSHVREHLEEEEFSDEEVEDEEEEEYSDEEDEEEEYSDDEPEQDLEPPRGHPGVPDFFNFGSHLTVKDNLLTVADDLLKNDGRKFIEMMEQLAERRMKRETSSHYDAMNHSAYPPEDAAYSHEDPLAVGEEYDDEGSYDSQYDDEEDIEDEDDMVGDLEMASPHAFLTTDRLQGALTDEQRMQEGRRMFQIFAARMFEQRVLNAYREKVAAERQRKLLEELDDESKLQEQREAKRQRDAQKKKDKKKQQQQAKAEEKAKKDAEKAEEEARQKEAEEKRLEEQRRKKEEQRKKREEEKRKQEEEKARKEADKLRRQQEEQQRREDAERKAREQKAAEKARKDEARKKERDEREAREKETKERKAQDDREKKEREARLKAEKEAKERERAANAPQHPSKPQIAKRPSQAGMVAIPGVYPKQPQPQSGVSSPHPSIATPAIPKTSHTTKHRQPSQQNSHASSPKQPQSQMSSIPSKSSSPGSVGPQQSQTQPKTIMQKMGNHQANQQMHHPPPTSSPLPHHHFQPPPGMSHMQQQGGFGNMPPMGFQGFPGPQGPMMPMGRQMPMFPHQGPPMGMQNRMPFANGMNGMHGMNGMGPPGMMMPQGRGFPFDAPGAQAPPGFGHNHHGMPQQTSPIGPPQQTPSGEQRPSLPGHSRQQSSDKERFESAANQPIARPAPIARPSSVKPPADRHGVPSEVDELSNHLGSSALLDDSDEPMPQNPGDARRHSNIAPGARNISIPGGFGPPMSGGFGNAGNTWNTPNMGINAPFGQSPGMQQAQPGWGSLPNTGMGSWMQQNNATFASNNSAFASNGGFGAGLGLGNGVGGHRPSGVGNRPLTIRIALCQACKQLNNASRGEGDGYHTVKVLLSQIAANRPPLDSPPTLREIEEICETEGDSQNGGGELYVRRSGADTPEGSTSGSGEQSPGSGFSVKWEAAADASTPDTSRGALKGLGEIGSPLPSKTSPAQGFGAPGSRIAPFGAMGGFQSMGAVNSYGN